MICTKRFRWLGLLGGLLLAVPGFSKDTLGLVQTKFGNIAISFLNEAAPKHVARFKAMAKKGFYDKTTFHRIVPGFMIQGGDPATKDSDPSNDGAGLPDQEKIPAEFSDLKHVRGIVSMARKKEVNSATSQFFILVSSRPHLDSKYTIFGRVVRGMETVDTIISQERDKYNKPLKRIEMRVKIIPRAKLSEYFR